MIAQNQIMRTLRERLSRVVEVTKTHPNESRTELARILCTEFSFVDPKGDLQLSGCLRALRSLESGGELNLPASRTKKKPTRRTARRLDAPIAVPAQFPDQVDELPDLRLELVRDEYGLRLWNELMISEHPLGDGPLVGRQVRYLLYSDEWLVGGAGFGSSALRLHDRDWWIGWDDAGRTAHLDKVVCLSRFLIRPKIYCANLASKALAMLCRDIAADFAAAYGYRPWLLESFVDPRHHSGACYRAANWISVGVTVGRGRQGAADAGEVFPKDIYMFILDEQFRTHLGTAEPDRYSPISIDKGLDRDSWAAHEFGGALLGDKRLESRLISIVDAKSRAPDASFLEAVSGDRAATVGYYRFLDQPDESGIDMEAIIQSHRDRTLQRMNGQKEVLCIHDTTDLNFGTLKACEGLGVIAKNKRNAADKGTTTAGLRLHASLVVTVPDGLPLGVLHANCYAPVIDKERSTNHRNIPIEERDSHRWVTSLQACMKLSASLCGTRVIHVMDREADFYELFEAWSDRQRDDLIIRARFNRRRYEAGGDEDGSEDGEAETSEDDISEDGEAAGTGADVLMFDHVAKKSLQGTIDVDIPRKTARSASGKNAAQPPRTKRRATLEVRYCPVAIMAPRTGLRKGGINIPVYLVHLKETIVPPDGSKMVEWFLLTTMKVDSMVVAEKVFRYYVKRWRIEEFNRVLKTGCGAEEPMLRTAMALYRLTGIHMVIAWRVLLMILLGREMPHLPPDVLFSDDEIKVLTILARNAKKPVPENLGDFIKLTAWQGGYLDRKNDGPPGAQVLGRGLTVVLHMANGFALARQS